MIKDEIRRLVEEAAARARTAGQLPAVGLPEVLIERPQRAEHGDYATNLPLRLARAARTNPMQVARAIADQIPVRDTLSEVSVAPPGFINFRLADAWLAAQVDAINQAGPSFAGLDLGQGRRVQVEFVSANPTGPIHVGNGRGATIGSTLANVLEAAGWSVEREYFVNDGGNQTDAFGRTLLARYLQLFGREVPVPEDGYPDVYMVDLAERVKAEVGDRYLEARPDEPPEELTLRGVDIVLEWIRDDLAGLGVQYDCWYRERTLYEGSPSAYDESMALLRGQGHLVEKEGAVWFASSSLGEDKDNVVIRSTGRPTYFASDIAYHYDKYVRRGFDNVIDVWGADHQGHVSRVKAAAAALGIEPDRLDLIIYQLVSLRRGDQVIRLSKRAGRIITIRELVQEVGADAARFFFLARSADSQMDFDIELAKRQSAENPVYYVQYAHARIAGILAHAAERIPSFEEGDVSLLTHPAELALVRRMLLLPELVEAIASTLEPHHLPHYAQDLATSFHDFYEKCRVVSDDTSLSRARLKLVNAARIALARTLSLMGVSAPDRM